MTLKQQLMEDMKSAMKSGDKEVLETVRYVIAKLKNVEIDQGELNDSQVQQLITKQIKEMKEVMVDYERAGRTDLAESDQKKIGILQKYLPVQLSETELDSLIDSVLAENPDAPLGQVIGKVNQQASGRADGRTIADKVKAKLTK